MKKVRCPSCGVEDYPMWDLDKEEWFCSNCLDTLHNLSPFAKKDEGEHIKDGAQK